MVFPCSLSMCFSFPISVLINLLGGEGAGLLIVHLFVSYAHVNLCHFFSSSWCRGLAAASACGSSWTFLVTFLTWVALLIFIFVRVPAIPLLEIGEQVILC